MARYKCGAFTCGYETNSLKALKAHRKKEHPTLSGDLYVTRGGYVY